MNFKIGDQIVYLPLHAKDLFDSDAEFGFITGFNASGSAFCRYWLNPKKESLRTTANSEATPIDMIFRCDLKPQKEINKLLIYLGYKSKWIFNGKNGEKVWKKGKNSLTKEKKGVKMCFLVKVFE